MMNITQAMQLMQEPDGIAQMLLAPSFTDEETGHEFSQAELIADVVNILRADTKRMGQAMGVPIEIDQMTPERAAELLQGVAMGDDIGLIEVFDQIEDKRMRLLANLESQQSVSEWHQQKQTLLYSHPAGQSYENPDVDISLEGDGMDSQMDMDFDPADMMNMASAASGTPSPDATGPTGDETPGE